MDHMSEHIYHLVCICADLHSEHMGGWGGGGERGKEGGRHEQERLCKAAGHSVLCAVTSNPSQWGSFKTPGVELGEQGGEMS